ncbi:hypothetical protein RchiOBHm_Chr5g0030141 [Rosa chinensis]|uniref:Uncharacterized protein n=1 Tax=Rosa chinensis TaxID=74649 RepID=A0A2P6Q9T9_ROSCH|nr:hypothetical protein RchiOBHm_Chr5g0030141 [Rosa chinensis]
MQSRSSMLCSVSLAFNMIQALISRFVIHNGRWYQACPHCFRQLKKKNNDLLICLEHNMQVPLPW